MAAGEAGNAERLAAARGIAGAETEIASRNTERGMYFDPIARALDAFGRDPRERSLPEDERMRLGELYAPDARRLAELLPEFDFELWPNVAKLL